MGRSVVDIFQDIEHRHTRTFQVGQGIGQCMRARPPHVAEGIDEARPPAQTHQPVTAVRRRAKDRVMTSKQAPGPGNMTGLDTRNVATDQNDRTGRRRGQCMRHAGAKIARSLGHAART